LALRFGIWDVDRFLKKIPPKLFAEWRAYAELEPFDETRQDIRTAQIAKWLAEIYRGMMIIGGAKGVSKETYKLEDYVLPFGEPIKPKPKQTWQEKKSIAMMIVAAYGKKTPKES
jgi:hypothetical protein